MRTTFALVRVVGNMTVIKTNDDPMFLAPDLMAGRAVVTCEVEELEGGESPDQVIVYDDAFDGMMVRRMRPRLKNA